MHDESAIDMDCAAVRDSWLTAAGPSPELAAHVQSCQACADLYADDGVLGRVLGAAGADVNRTGSSAHDPAALSHARIELEARLRRERGPLAWLRSRPTWLRLTLGLGCVMAVVAWFLAAAHRPDLGQQSALELVSVFGAICLLVLASLALLLRPLHRAALPRWTYWLLLGAGIALPVALIGLQQVHQADAGPNAPPATDGCLVLGLLACAPVFLVAQGLRQARVGGAAAAVLAGVAAGLSGYLCLHIHCAATSFEHLLIGHASVVAIAMMLAFGVDKLAPERA